MMHNPKNVQIRTYTVKADGKVVLETTYVSKMAELVKGYKLFPPYGEERKALVKEWKASTDRIKVIITGNYASMDGFIHEFYR